MKTIKFETFGRTETGRVVTEDARNGLRAVFARNPYGRHNLVLVDHQARALRHGNRVVLGCLDRNKTFRRAVEFLRQRGFQY